MLKKLTKLEHDADHFGLRWENPHQVMAQIQSECLEINGHLSHITDESKPKLGVLTISPANDPSSFKPAWLSQIST